MSREAMQQALEALEAANDCSVWPNTLKQAAQIPKAITALRAALEAPDVADPILPPHPEHGWTWTDVERKFLERWASEFAVHCVREAADNLNAEWQATLERRFGPGEIAESGWKCRMVLYDWNGLPIGHRQPEAEELRHALQGTTHPPAQPQGWVLVPAYLLQKAADVLEEATTYTHSESWSPSMTDELLALRQEMLAARPKETT